MKVLLGPQSEVLLGFFCLLQVELGEGMWVRPLS
jgi:hypothetical protein